MGNFNRSGNGGNKFGGRGGGGRGFSGGGNRGGGFGGRRERPEMHKATCDACGNSCELPFRPTGDKPVYCSSCFEENGGGGRDRGGRDFGRDRGGRDFGSRESKPSMSDEKLDQVIAKLDKIITLMQRTSPVKEVTVMKAGALEEAVEETIEILGKESKKKAPAKKTVTKKAVAKKAPAKKTAAKKASKAKKK